MRLVPYFQRKGFDDEDVDLAVEFVRHFVEIFAVEYRIKPADNVVESLLYAAAAERKNHADTVILCLCEARLRALKQAGPRAA